MPAGKEIKRLILNARLSAANAAKAIGVDADRLRKWMERDADPKDTGDIQAVEAFFGCSLANLSRVDKFPTISKTVSNGQKNAPTVDYREKYIALLEEKIASSDALIVKLNSILAYQQTIYEGLILKIAKDHKRKPQEVRDELDNILADKTEEVLRIGS